MKTIVLCSGGLDSTVLLHSTVKQRGNENVIALNIFYGQRHDKEVEYARWQCSRLGVKLYEVDLSQVFTFNPDCCALLANSSQEIDHRSYGEQVSELKDGENISAYVPYRNGLFLSYATAVAIQLGCNFVCYGAHKDDAAGSAYPDCSEEFMMAQAEAISQGTNGAVTMEAPFWDHNKADVVHAGIECGMTHEDFEHTWSCYEGKDVPCGICGTCIDRSHAFAENRITDIL